MNIIRQATKLGIKNFSVASSTGAVRDRNSLKPLYTSDGTIPPNRHVSTQTDFIPPDRLESDYERADSHGNP